jgi:hypothetical protein
VNDKTKKSKADLLKMLAEAVRNTQPQPIDTRQSEPIRDTQPKLKRKTRPVAKRTAKTENPRASASGKQRRR